MRRHSKSNEKAPETPARVRTHQMNLSNTSVALSSAGVKGQHLTDHPVLKEALDAVRRGWAVLPLVPGGKEPLSTLLPKDRFGKPSWRLLALQPATEAEIRTWFTREPNLNLGIILGEASGGLVVVDVDRKPAKPLHLPPTVVVNTARGAHYYFRASKSVQTLKTSWGELRGENAYVVVSGRHPAGVPYLWGECCSPAEIDVADLPEDLLQTAEEEAMEQRKARQKNPGRVSNKQYTGNRLPSPGSEVTFDYLDWVTREDVALSIIRACGVEKPQLGKAFKCVLPGHSERKASASLYRHADNVIQYRDWHMKDGAAWFSLSEIFASVTAGRVMRLGPGERVVWLIRALIHCGYLKAPSVWAPKLPADVKPVIADVYNGFRLLVAVRHLYNGAADGTMFSWRFASSWCGRSERHTGESIRWLLKHGYLRQVQCQVQAGKRATALFQLGTGRSQN